MINYFRVISHNSCSLFQEYYDLEQRLFRLDTYYDGRLGGPPGPISIIHDFNLETQYIINHRFANCSISPLTAESPFVFFDVSIADSPDRPSLATPNQILFLSNEFNYSYEGVTTVRGVEVDSWLSVREFERLGFGLNFTDAVLEFYFTRPGWKIASQIDVSETPIPWGASFRGVISYYNTSSNMTESLNITGENDILGFTTEEPLFDIYDTSICIEPTEYVILTMFFAGHETGMDFGQLRRAIRSAIVDYTGITPLQVGNIQVGSRVLCTGGGYMYGHLLCNLHAIAPLCVIMTLCSCIIGTKFNYQIYKVIT